MKRPSVPSIIFIILATLFLSRAAYAAEIIYDSPEDLRATAPAAAEASPPPTPLAQSTPETAPMNVAEQPAPEGTAQAQANAGSPPPATEIEKAKQRYEELKEKVDSGSDNLDVYFEYAQLATALGKPDEAASAYRFMIDRDDSLDRIRLELGLLYVRMGKLKQSKQLFAEVLEKNPPEEVKANIAKVMEVVNQGLKPDTFSGSVSTGYNVDSNANSAASSGQTTFVDTSIPLSTGSTASRDGHFYVSTSLTHNHKFDIENDFYKLSYETTGTIYRTHQDTEHNLDLGMISIKTGPILEMPELKTKLGFNVSENMVTLDNHKYMKTRSLEQNISYALMDNLLLNGAYSYEYRQFINTTLATTYTDRSGNANQVTFGATYALTPLDIFNSSVVWRYENAESPVYGTTQASITGGYTRVLPWDMTFNTVFGFKKTNYHAPDPLVSATILRHDRERSMTYTLAKKLPYNVTASTSYQYKNEESNIQNYKYHNNRYSAALSWGF